MLDGIGPVLWGDTIVANITSYVERYFLPILSQLPKHIWGWKKQEKKLLINGQVCDFRSADQPENWEGFGYRLVILNEAGIILKNQYLWHNAVRPMLMDFPDSICVIGGTPKGKNLFHELWAKGGENWQSFTFDSYSNPFISDDEIREMESELPAAVVRQEIYAEFVGEGGNYLIPYDMVITSMKREPIEAVWGAEIWGVDVARHGDDYSVLSKRHYKNIYEVKSYSIADTMQLASAIDAEYQAAPVKPQHIFVETTGMGWGVYDRLKELRCPVMIADVGCKATMSGVLNKRAEMYVRLHTAMKEGLKLPDDRALLRQLSNIPIEYNEKALLKIVSKEKIKEELGESPDKADACALTYYEELPPIASQEDYVSHHIKADYNPFEEARC